MLSLMILHVRSKVDFEEVTEVGNVIAGPCRHLGKPGVEFVKAVDSDHVINVSQLLEVLA